ncbi:hypothetical protein QYM36_009013 [Artemia franciscana]|uniref:Uncharacterized protein n=1 Tax=Artemia franciscana TaxID=6661 RepID=A0AA88L6N7_ARTSF|nr:hypothetical protein QYM36_009013 [Artemia franciscana]
MSSQSEVDQSEMLAAYLARQYRRSYRYGISLLMLGALLNWVGFAQSYLLPIRYLGVACVMAGTICVCAAICKWSSAPNIIQEPPAPEPPTPVPTLPSKPPEYSTLAPPSYEEAILLNPGSLMTMKSQILPDSSPTCSTSGECVINIEPKNSNSDQLMLTVGDNLIANKNEDERGMQK